MRILPWSIGRRGGSIRNFLTRVHYYIPHNLFWEAVLENVYILDEFFLIIVFKIYAQYEENFTKKDDFNCEQ